MGSTRRFKIRLHHHVALSLLGTGVVYILSHSFSATLAFFFSGIFIDLDHLFEYVHKFGIRGFSLKTFFRAAYRHEYRHYFVLLHSYELVAACWLLSLLFIRRPWAWGITAGITLHILSDQLYNPCHPLTYFFFYRLRHKFDGEKLFPLEKRQKFARRK